MHLLCLTNFKTYKFPLKTSLNEATVHLTSTAHLTLLHWKTTEPDIVQPWFSRTSAAPDGSSDPILREMVNKYHAFAAWSAGDCAVSRTGEILWRGKVGSKMMKDVLLRPKMSSRTGDVLRRTLYYAHPQRMELLFHPCYKLHETPSCWRLVVFF